MADRRCIRRSVNLYFVQVAFGDITSATGKGGGLAGTQRTEVIAIAIGGGGVGGGVGGRIFQRQLFYQVFQEEVSPITYGIPGGRE